MRIRLYNFYCGLQLPMNSQIRRFHELQTCRTDLSTKFVARAPTMDPHVNLDARRADDACEPACRVKTPGHLCWFPLGCPRDELTCGPASLVPVSAAAPRHVTDCFSRCNMPPQAAATSTESPGRPLLLFRSQNIRTMIHHKDGVMSYPWSVR